MAGASRMFAMLCDDHRIALIDIDRLYSLVSLTACKSKKFTDFWSDRCSNLLVGITNEGDLELYRTKTMINYQFKVKSDEMKKGGDTIHRVQTLLKVTEREAYNPRVKEVTLPKEKQVIEAEGYVVDEKLLLRENWVCPSDTQNFSLKELRSFLRKHSVFPDKYRPIIWTFLLSLPKNVLAYDNYLKKGAHKDIEKYENTFPLKNQALSKKLGRVLSSLSQYCGLFADQNLIPFVTFPFVKLFNHDECLSFEVTLAFMCHWGQHLMENYPHPSATMIEYVIFSHPGDEISGIHRP
jgi:hypothetical protein